MKFTKPNRRNGSAVIIMLGLITLVLMLVAANTASVRNLDRELQVLNQRQMQHWSQMDATNRTVLTPP